MQKSTSVRKTGSLVQLALVAALAALAVASFAMRFGPSIETLQFTGLAGILAWASLEDLNRRVIPNTCILAATGLRIACLAALMSVGKLAATDVAYYVASGLGTGAVLLLFALVFERITSRKGMGGGDVKLYAVAGLYAGNEAAFGIVLLSCVLVLIASAVLPHTDSEKNTLDRAFPFGPAIACSLVLFLLFG